MWFSYKTKRLLIISIAVIILAIAANEGSKESGKNVNKTSIYPYVPADIDPSTIDPNIDSANIPLIKAKPLADKVADKVIAPSRQEISAEAYIVANLDTGEIYSERNAQTVFPIASLSKLITALVVLHSMQPEQKLTVNQAMLDAYGDAGHLVLGETFTASELLYPMLLESSNDAAEVFAQSYGADEFIRKMNAFTAGLGMISTFFKDSSGLNAGNSSNAHDLFILSQYIYKSEKPLLELTRRLAMSVATTTEHSAHTWNTINPFPLDPHFMGGKTGRTTEAKESMISLFRYDRGITSYPVAVIVLRSDFKVREIDSSMLFEKFINKINGN